MCIFQVESDILDSPDILESVSYLVLLNKSLPNVMTYDSNILTSHDAVVWPSAGQSGLAGAHSCSYRSAGSLPGAVV